MKKQIITDYEVLTPSELTPAEQQLVDLASRATFRSYAPYSNFRVGAAIRLSDGAIVTGANQENVAYPSGTCAERTACFYAHAEHPDARFEAIAIAARGTDGQPLADPISPCGACRQSLMQYEVLAGSPVEVLLVGRDTIYRLPSIRSLLPFAFTSL
ncbi:MAG: cytidine deaminase [Bacteroides sp.]|nr:cytidine deaminase [Bacteroides sp.]